MAGASGDNASVPGPSEAPAAAQPQSAAVIKQLKRSKFIKAQAKKRLKLTSNDDRATTSPAVPEGPIDVFKLPLDRLPTGFPVFAESPVMPAWKPGEAPQLPILLSFRQLLREQYSADELLGRRPIQEPSDKSSAKEVVEAEVKVGSHEPQEDDLLAGIGRKPNPLDEVIRSMENRLARQGLLAAPGTIISKQKKRPDEQFYDHNDTFIDDAELEEINAFDEQRSRKKRVKGAAEPPEPAELASTQDPSGVAATTAAGDEDFLTGFRITSMEVSGTSEESDSGSDEEELYQCGLASNPWKKDNRSWRIQLTFLRDEVVPKAVADYMSSEQGAESLLTESASLGAIDKVFQECCTAIESSVAAETAKAQPQQVWQRPRLEVPATSDLEAALQSLYRRLPPLLRFQQREEFAGTEAPARRQRWKLHRFEPSMPAMHKKAQATGDLDDGAESMPDAAKEVEFLPWTEAEEVAWCCYTWRLLGNAAPGLRRAAFLRSWISAAKAPQNEEVEKALVQVKSLCNLELGQDERKAIQEAAKRWHEGQGADKKLPLSNHSALRPLRPGMTVLRGLWLRKRLWQDQAQHNRVRVGFAGSVSNSWASWKGGREVYRQQSQAIATWVADKLKDFTGLILTWDMLVKLPKKLNISLRTRALLAKARAKPKAKSKPAEPTPDEEKKVGNPEAAEAEPADEGRSRKDFLKNLDVGSWCRAKILATTNYGIPKQWYNAKVTKILARAKDGPKEVEVHFAGGPKQDTLVRFLQEPEIFVANQTVQYFHGGTWLPSLVNWTKGDNNDLDKVTVGLIVGDRTYKAGYNVLRPSHPESGARKSLPASASARGSGRGAADQSRGRGRGRGRGRKGRVVDVPEDDEFPSRELLKKGTHVKFQRRGSWNSGVVIADQGGDIVYVSTSDGANKTAAAITVPFDAIEVIHTFHAKPSAKSAGKVINIA
eukprot:TRINITY_DN39516_c0_g2_i1.p1 TRINITY_DN39516_c0_g2~~TRINITY_DN39516_c0_g2_i1.p1  ORF type:complete len:944 (+),score=234.46 TRINITY_DN39516_c0_g2_i1:72-2903(+)